MRLIERTGAKVYVLGEQRVDLAMAFKRVAENGIERLLVEGGATLNAALLRLGLVDEIMIYLAPLVFGGADAPTLADAVGLPRDQAVELSVQSVDLQPDGGVLLHYKVLHKGT